MALAATARTSGIGSTSTSLRGGSRVGGGEEGGEADRVICDSLLVEVEGVVRRQHELQAHSPERHDVIAEQQRLVEQHSRDEDAYRTVPRRFGEGSAGGRAPRTSAAACQHGRMKKRPWGGVASLCLPPPLRRAARPPTAAQLTNQAVEELKN